MAKSTSITRETSPLQLRDADEAARTIEPDIHVYGPNAVCETRGYATPGIGRILSSAITRSARTVPVAAPPTPPSPILAA
jgi:hypothetical protein